MDFFSKKIAFFLITVFLSCGSSLETPEPNPANIPEIIIRDSRIFEQEGNSVMQFEVVPQSAVEQPISITYTIEGVTAEPGVDFVAGTGNTIMGVGTSNLIIEVTILDDAIKEVDEKIIVTLAETPNAIFKKTTAIGIIRDNEMPTNFDEEGYLTPESYYGYELAWQDEFNGEMLNLEHYNFDLDDGCPNLCGWGNNELQWYTNEPKNISVTDGKLIIKATKQGASSYNSAKIHTKDKQSFQFGRIDVRAKLPKGQGIWPAIWMLGNNIDEVGWPACGEVDIMEMVGHKAQTIHGTAHWGPQGAGGSTFTGAAISLEEEYAEKFHVFTLLWEANQLVWYMDETPFHIITPADMQGQEYRFNTPFYMIFNVAVGGNWPGNPDETTVFPQQMEIDYVRYFK